jgi:hypothetical protein
MTSVLMAHHSAVTPFAGLGLQQLQERSERRD